MSTREQAKAEMQARHDTERAEMERRHLAERAALEDLPRGSKPRRLRTRYRIEAARGDTSAIPRAFTVREDTEYQVEDKRVSGGWAAERRIGTRDVTGPMSRREVVTLIESGSGWLAYLGEDG
jgi:hypothetical protein